jgi:hypothetical protein
MSEEQEEEFKRGPKGARAHTPGKGHDRKSAEQRKSRFVKKADRKRKAKNAALRAAWDYWDAMPLEAQKLRQDKKPVEPRPADED